MTTLSWSPRSTGAEYRPPTFRVQAARVVAAPEADSPPPADWHEEIGLPHWTPLQLSWAANGRPSTLTLRRVLGVGTGKAVRDRAEADCLAAGDRIRLVEVAGGGPRGTEQREWFRGYVAQSRLLVQGDPAGEACDVTAYGPEALLAGKVVCGQWHAIAAVDESIVAGTFSAEQLVAAGSFRSRLPAVFNQHGLPNASPATSGGTSARWRLDEDAQAASPGAAVFDAPGRKVLSDTNAYQAEFWSAATAVRSLIEAIDGYRAVSAESVGLLPEALGDLRLGEVEVEGLGLIDALRAVLAPLGYGFCLEPWAGPDGRHALRVFELQGKTTGSRVRRPYMAPILGAVPGATDPEGRRAEVQRIDFLRDNHGVRNDVTVIGAARRSQIVLTFAAGGGQLQCVWDTTAHDLAGWAEDDVVDPMQWPVSACDGNTIALFEQRHAYGAKGQAEYRHVFRSFAWNEDGAFRDLIDSMPDASECGVGGSGRFLRRPRPVGPTLLRDEGDGKVRNLPAFVQLGIEGDDSSWIQVPAVIWTDRAGFTLPVNPLWGWYPYADPYARHASSGDETLYERYGQHNYLTLLHNALRDSGTKLSLRLVGSVECDDAAVGRAPRLSGSSWPVPAERVIRAEDRYQWREVPAGSDPFGLGAARHDTRDDADDAAAHAERVRDALGQEVGHGSVLLRHLTRSYAPGDVVPGTRGREIDLTVRTGLRCFAPVVVAVVWDLRAGKAATELLLDSALLRTTP